MNSVNEKSLINPAESLNYFNYFTEVEEEFVRRRGKPLLISPMDWALVESWKNAGIPLHVVLRAINQAFDSYDARARKFRKVNSMFYCQQEVEATFAQYRLAQVGENPVETATPPTGESRLRESRSARERRSAFPKEILLDFLARSDTELGAAQIAAVESEKSSLGDTIGRARNRLGEIRKQIEQAARADDEALEHDLDSIDRLILNGLIAEGGQSHIESLRAEAESQLQAYRKKMDKEIYDQTLNNFVFRRLRETNHIPRLSLFYI